MFTKGSKLRITLGSFGAGTLHHMRKGDAPIGNPGDWAAEQTEKARVLPSSAEPILPGQVPRMVGRDVSYCSTESM